MARVPRPCCGWAGCGITAQARRGRACPSQRTLLRRAPLGVAMGQRTLARQRTGSHQRNPIRQPHRQSARLRAHDQPPEHAARASRQRFQDVGCVMERVVEEVARSDLGRRKRGWSRDIRHDRAGAQSVFDREASAASWLHHLSGEHHVYGIDSISSPRAHGSQPREIWTVRPARR